MLIELKQDDEDFEEYNPDWLFLRAIKYEENIDYQQLQPDIIAKYSQVVRVNKKQDSIYDLESRLAELYGIPQNKVVILLRL